MAGKGKAGKSYKMTDVPMMKPSKAPVKTAPMKRSGRKK